jgi:hypothetical protein
MPCITITFCDCSENHVGMEQIGDMSQEGYTKENFDTFQTFWTEKGMVVERVNLNTLLNEDIEDIEDIGEVLIVRGAINNHLQIFDELMGKEWDTKYWDVRRKKVLNKHARANLCFSEVGQDSDYENKKGTIVSYDELPLMNELKTLVNDCVGDIPECEGNLYKDVTKNGIGWHGDSERKRVVAVRFGEPMPLCFRWYHQSKIISETFNTIIYPGDLYIMNYKAVGTDWKKRSKITLRHSAGAMKYIK